MDNALHPKQMGTFCDVCERSFPVKIFCKRCQHIFNIQTVQRRKEEILYNIPVYKPLDCMTGPLDSIPSSSVRSEIKAYEEIIRQRRQHNKKYYDSYDDFCESSLRERIELLKDALWIGGWECKKCTSACPLEEKSRKFFGDTNVLYHPFKSKVKASRKALCEERIKLYGEFTKEYKKVNGNSPLLIECPDNGTIVTVSDNDIVSLRSFSRQETEDLIRSVYPHRVVI